MKKYIFPLILFLTVLLGGFSFAENDVANQMVRIGLFFGNSAISEARIEGENLSISTNTFLGDNYETNQNKLIFTINNQQISIVDSNGIQQQNFSNDGKLEVASKSGKIKINGKEYRGTLLIESNTKGNFTVINYLPMEEYLYGVVPKEMPSSWNLEALKAQAVAARTYTIKNLNKYASQGFDLCTTQNCQVYGGVESENLNTNMAVDGTRGMVAYYNGAPIQAVYHSTSGGSTDNSENLWNEYLPYLRGVQDPYSIGNPYDSWNYQLNKESLENMATKSGKNIGTLRGIKIDAVSPTNRVLQITLVGSKGNLSLEKEKIRSFFGYSNIRSNSFTINGNANAPIYSNTIKGNSFEETIFSDLSQLLTEKISNTSAQFITGNQFNFTGNGYGHGIGLSQYGAKAMADQGFSYDQILKFYYQGIDIY